MKIYTKTGDKGETSLFGGKRVGKDDLRIRAYGTIDELNSILGVTITEVKSEELVQVLHSIQNDLFTVGANLATPPDKGNKGFEIQRVNEKFSSRIEESIDEFEKKLTELRTFILPGGTKGAALLHFSRTICRRAEREVVALTRIVEVNAQIAVYLNRLSDLLFVLARFENFSYKHPDIEWKK